MSFTSISGFQINKNIIIPSFKGDILYVDGSGEGNYTKIQDAIDNASDGDTVFVFDDSSPYNEKIVIRKSIDLVGENRDTTVIDGNETGNVITINSSYVTIDGFTIQRCDDYFNAGIKIGYEDYYHITILNNNIINNFGDGISWFSNDEEDYSGYINIIGNNISNNERHGVSIRWEVESIVIQDNIISNNRYGVSVDVSKNIKIINYIIKHNEYGGVYVNGWNIEICNNMILFYSWGISVGDSFYTFNILISGNNIGRNKENGIELDNFL